MSDYVKIRVVLDYQEEDVIRDLEVRQNLSLEKLHRGIVKAFGLPQGEMASFFKTNNHWDQGEEISLVDMGLSEKSKVMKDFIVQDFFPEKGSRLLYLYDFLNLWTFFVEALDIFSQPEKEEDVALVGQLGKRPAEPPQKDMQSGDFLDSPDDFDDNNGYPQ